MCGRVAPVAPASDEKRYGEAPHRVHQHHGADQAGRLPDLGEQHGQIGGRDGTDEPCADRRGREDDEVREASLRASRERKGARERSRYERFARDRTPRANRVWPRISSRTFLPAPCPRTRRRTWPGCASRSGAHTTHPGGRPGEAPPSVMGLQRSLGIRSRDLEAPRPPRSASRRTGARASWRTRAPTPRPRR